MIVTSSHGDVDADGQIVDRDARVLSGIGEHLADGITRASQLELVNALLPGSRLSLPQVLLLAARAA